MMKVWFWCNVQCWKGMGETLCGFPACLSHAVIPLTLLLWSNSDLPPHFLIHLWCFIQCSTVYLPFVICCIFTKSSSDFTAILTYSTFLIQLWLQVASAKLLSYCLFKVCLFLLLMFLLLFSDSPFCLPFYHLLFILWSLFVPCVPFHHFLFFACDSLVPGYILPFPSLAVGCDYSLFILLLFSIVMTTPYYSVSVYNKLKVLQLLIN